VLGHSSDGEEAWQLIWHLQPDVAVLDTGLSRLPLTELFRRMKEFGLTTKILLVSARGDRKTAVDALRTGAAGFLLKSGTARHLEDALREVLRGDIYISPLVEMHRLAQIPRRDADNPLETLSSREHQVFTMLVEGVRAKEIASRLALSPKTVDTYRASLMRKLAIHDVPGLVKLAIQYKVVEVAM